MELKYIASIIGAIVVIFAYIPYIRDIHRGRTKPHLYTWVIWFLTLGTALAGMWYGGAKIAALGYLPSLFLVVLVIGLSLKYGTRNITLSDTVTLLLALAAILVWWLLENPLVSVLMATAIDAIGYIPTMRKSYAEPLSETLSTWTLFTISCVFLILSLESYSLITTVYLTMSAVANLLLIEIILVRRRATGPRRNGNPIGAV